MTSDVMKEIKRQMNIPKRHTLRHYITQAGRLYGEPEKSLATYADEQVIANEGDLDGAIECFKGLLPVEDALAAAKAAKLARWQHPKK